MESRREQLGRCTVAPPDLVADTAKRETIATNTWDDYILSSGSKKRMKTDRNRGATAKDTNCPFENRR